MFPSSARPVRRSLGGLALGLLAAPAFTSGTPDSGYCHLSRWMPPELVPTAEAGSSVAFDGDTAVVAAVGAEQVYVFERSGGTWQQVATLSGPAPAGAGFGTAVGLEDDLLVVGAPHDGFTGVNAGAVFVYERELTGWEFREALHGTPGSLMGRAVDVDRNDAGAIHLAAGAPGGSGSVLLFLRSGSSWSLVDTLTRPGTHEFGDSLDLDGPTLVVGDYGDDTNGIESGAVYHYLVLPALTPFVQKITPSHGEIFDRFGESVAVDGGNRLLVGAPGDDEVDANAGAAYVYELRPSAFYPYVTFTDELELLPCASASANFGHSVDISDDGACLVVGAYDEGILAPGGSVHVFRPSPVFPSTWVQSDFVLPADGNANDGFGWSVALAGPHLLIGSPGVDEAGGDSGAAYLVSFTRKTQGGGQCSCDVLARVDSYGVGKAGTLGIPELSVSRPPVPGESCLFKLANALAGVQPVIFWGTQAANLAFDGGAFYMSDPSGELMPVVSALNQVGVQWVLPNDPALCGSDVLFQVMFLDPGAAGAYRTAQTNALHTIVGF